MEYLAYVKNTFIEKLWCVKYGLHTIALKNQLFC